MIKSLSGIKFEMISKAFSEAFADYEVQITKEELALMLKRRGFVPELSFAAFSEGEIVAFTLNGIGTFGAIKTAYDTGTGTIKEFRGRGLATEIFKHSLPFLKNAGINQYLLEVLQNNKKAISVYQRLGFEISREFNYFVHKADKTAVRLKELEQIEIVQTTHIDKLVMQSFWDFEPAWQNNFEAIARNPENFILLAALEKSKVLGYAILAPKSGDITQIAVDRKHRRKGIATALLNAILQHNLHNNIKVVNSDVKCISLTRFLETNSIAISGKQYEMKLSL